jgi:hypothetical protein
MWQDDSLLEALQECLHGLNDLRLVPHNDLNILRLKQHLREKISELDSKETGEREAA